MSGREYSPGSGNAWNFNTNNGNQNNNKNNNNNNNKNNPLYAWAVRSGMMSLVEPCSLFTFANLYRHYLSCRKGKRNTCNALRFEARQELNLLELAKALQERSYRPSSSVCFVTQRPKMREIFAADFKDRIVHHVLVDELERYWEPVFFHDSYACRWGKGIHQAVKRLRQFIRQGSGNGQQQLWYLQLDIRNYFMSIDKTVLFGLLKPHIDKRSIGTTHRGFDFLGYRIHPDRLLHPALQSLNRLLDRSRRLYEQGVDENRLRQFRRACCLCPTLIRAKCRATIKLLPDYPTVVWC